MNPIMKAAVVVSALIASLAWAGPKSYQVTGEVIEVRDDTLVILKGKEKFEIAKGTAGPDVKVGQKVTVEYKMTATSVEVKDKK